jgi:hypothetical protein
MSYNPCIRIMGKRWRWVVALLPGRYPLLGSVPTYTFESSRVESNQTLESWGGCSPTESSRNPRESSRFLELFKPAPVKNSRAMKILTSLFCARLVGRGGGCFTREETWGGHRINTKKFEFGIISHFPLQFLLYEVSVSTRTFKIRGIVDCLVVNTLK